LQHIFHVTKNYLMELKNEEYWPAYTSQILCSSPDMKITLKGRLKSSQIRTDIDIREHDRTQKKNMFQHYWIVLFSSLIIFHLFFFL